MVDFDDYHEKRIIVRMNAIWLALGVSSLIAYLAFSGSVFPIPEKDTLGEWFQRSGSIIVVVAIFAELAIYKLPQGMVDTG
jgi:hypothetical protein